MSTEEPNKIKIQNLSKIINPGLSYSGFFGLAGSSVNPDKITAAYYENMLETDETCSSGIDFVTAAVISRLGDYHHPDTEINDFINNQFTRIRGTVKGIAQKMLSALWAGFSAGELIFEYRNGRYELADIQFIHPSMVEFELHDDGLMKNRIKSIKIKNSSDGVSADKFLIYTHQAKFENPYGTSRLKSICPVYHMKKNLIPFWAKTLEKYGAPTAVARTKNPNDLIVDSGGLEMSNMDYLAKILTNMQNTTGIVLSGDDEIKFEYGDRSVGADFAAAVNYCNRMIYRGLLLPSLVADNDGSASRALGEVHYELFKLSLDQLRDEIAETLIEQLVRKLIEWNYGAQKSWGAFRTEKFSMTDAKLFADIFESMANNGFINASRYEDASFVREKLGLPGIPKEEFNPIKEEPPAEADQKQEEAEEERAEEKIQNKNSGDPRAEEKLKKMSRTLNSILASFFEEGDENR